MFFCYIASLPNLWEFDLELVIHVNIANFLLFCVFLSVSCRFSFNFYFSNYYRGASGKEPVCQAGELRDAVLILGLGRYPEEGMDNTL